MKFLRISKYFIIFLFCCLISVSYGADTQEIKEEAIALYATKNYQQAYKLLESLPKEAKDCNVLILLSNIALEILQYNI